MIWVIGGTTEAKHLANRLEGKKPYIVTVATYSGAELLEHSDIVVKRMNSQEMQQFIADNSINTVVDMSHPYAIEVTQNAKTACNNAGIRYIRFVRKGSDVQTAVNLPSVEACSDFLQNIKGNVFFTTGIKNIKDFERVKGQNRFIYRVLPSSFSIQECIDNNIKMQDIIAILGPVSEELNYQMFKDYYAAYVVMKDSGKEGGTEEKLRACKRLGIVPIVIGRQQEDNGLEDLDMLLEMII